MTSTDMARHGARTARREPATHAFAVGQAVQLRDGIGRLVAPGALYKITATLPSGGGAPQYRIRNDDERYERVAGEDSLRRADIAAKNENATLIERTFGRG